MQTARSGYGMSQGQWTNDVDQEASEEGKMARWWM